MRTGTYRNQIVEAFKPLSVEAGPSGRRAELNSAGSRISNPLAAAKFNVLPNAIRRYSRLEICANPLAALRLNASTLQHINAPAF